MSITEKHTQNTKTEKIDFEKKIAVASLSRNKPIGISTEWVDLLGEEGY